MLRYNSYKLIALKDYNMRKLTTKPNEYNSASKVIKQAVDDRMDEVCWRTLKTYPYYQDMNVCTIYDYVEITGLYLYDFDKMIEIYQKENGLLPFKVVKDKTALGPVSRMFVYYFENLNSVWNYFNDGREPIHYEYVSLKDFVNAIKGVEDFVTVRTRWYKRLELAGVEREPGLRKRKNKLADFSVSRLEDKINTNDKTKAFFYKLTDLFAIAEIYKNADERKQNQKRKEIEESLEETKQPA